MSSTKGPEKNLRKLLQGACGPKRVNVFKENNFLGAILKMYFLREKF